MKTTSPQLFNLIKSLNKAEKSYFKKNIKSFQSGTRENQYLKLFNALDKQEEFDEAAIIDKFRGDPLIKQFSVSKNYLYNLILKTLVGFHSGKTIEAILNRQIDNSSVLYNKGFYRECIAELKRGKKLSYKYDKHDYLLTIIKKEKQLITDLKTDDLDNDLRKEVMEEEAVFNKIATENKLSVVYFNLLKEVRSRRIIRSKEEMTRLAELSKEILAMEEKTLPTFVALNYFYGIQVFYNYLSNQFGRSVEFGLKHQRMWDQSPWRMLDNPQEYLDITYYFLSSCFQTRNFQEIIRGIYKLKSTGITNPQQATQRYFIYYSILIRYYASLFMYNELEDILYDVNRQYDEYSKHMLHDQHITICLNMIIAHFIMEQYSMSLKWLNRFFVIRKPGVREDAYAFTRIFNLIIHFELGNNDLLEYTVKSTYRDMTRKQKLYQFEKSILTFIKKVSAMPGEKEYDNLLQDLENQLKEINRDPLESEAMRYFNFIGWIESKLHKMSYREYNSQIVRKLKPL